MVPSTVVMPREGSFALASFGRVRKVQEPTFAVAAGRKSFALKRILERFWSFLLGIADTQLKVASSPSPSSMLYHPSSILYLRPLILHLLSRNAFPITTRSDNPIAAAQRMGLMNPNAASGMPTAL